MSTPLLLNGLIATGSAIFRAAIAVGCCLIALNASAAEKPSIDYSCPKYEADIQFYKKRVEKSYGHEFSTPEFPAHIRTGSSSSDLIDCSTKTMLCLAERVKSQPPDTDVFVYALPRRTTVGDTYQMRGATFRVYESAKFPGHKQWVMVMAEIGDISHRLRYKMYVEQGVGIRDFHFEQLRANPPGSNELSREYMGVTCSLMSKQGLFSGVRVHIPPSDHHIID
jgi:hypothetical protein